MKAIFLIINGILLVVIQQPYPMYVPESGGTVAQMQRDPARFIAHDYLSGSLFYQAEWMVVTWEGGSRQGYRVIGDYYCANIDGIYADCPWGATALGERVDRFEGSVLLMTCAPGGWLLVVAAPAVLVMGEELVHVDCNLCEMVE